MSSESGRIVIFNQVTPAHTDDTKMKGATRFKDDDAMMRGNFFPGLGERTIAKKNVQKLMNTTSLYTGFIWLPLNGN